MKHTIEFESDNYHFALVQNLLKCFNKNYKVKMFDGIWEFKGWDKEIDERIKNITIDGVKYDKNCKESKED